MMVKNHGILYAMITITAKLLWCPYPQEVELRGTMYKILIKNT